MGLKAVKRWERQQKRIKRELYLIDTKFSELLKYVIKQWGSKNIFFVPFPYCKLCSKLISEPKEFIIGFGMDNRICMNILDETCDCYKIKSQPPKLTNSIHRQIKSEYWDLIREIRSIYDKEIRINNMRCITCSKYIKKPQETHIYIGRKHIYIALIDEFCEICRNRSLKVDRLDSRAFS